VPDGTRGCRRPVMKIEVKMVGCDQEGSELEV
jgi:hypothetical protein